MGHHEELLDLLGLAVLVQRDVLCLEARDEVAVLVENDGIDFDELSGRSERRLLPRGAEGGGTQGGETARGDKRGLCHGGPSGLESILRRCCESRDSVCLLRPRSFWWRTPVRWSR